jgi:hypothetical protein
LGGLNEGLFISAYQVVMLEAVAIPPMPPTNNMDKIHKDSFNTFFITMDLYTM